MNVWPLRFRRLSTGAYAYSNDTGASFISDEGFLTRYVNGRLTANDQSFLLESGCAYEEKSDLYYTSALQRFAARQNSRSPISYVILVPTLRCNLSCSYCQVSRANESAIGFDWSNETLEAALSFLGQLKSHDVKIEFQGGEPLLRVDLLERVRAFCVEHFDSAEFVVCTNLQKIGNRELAFLDRADVQISTSLDGDVDSHKRNRTETAARTDEFFHNLRLVVDRYGPTKVSALPTIDFANPPDLERLIAAYDEHGLKSIYLRPVHYHGFARKSHAYANTNFKAWQGIYLSFIDMLIERNWRRKDAVEEFYFSTCLKRVLRTGLDGHVDLRNPNLYAADYIVIDYDGKLYPTDEARMLARIGQIDLSIGTISEGINRQVVSELNWQSVNSFHEDCIHCTYQPYCGIDVIDDIARYGRIDVPKASTWFCQQQIMIFDRIFEYLCSDDERVHHSLAQWAGLRHWPRAPLARHHDTVAASR